MTKVKRLAPVSFGFTLTSVAKEFNVSTLFIVNELATKGWFIENRPTSVITEEMYDHLYSLHEKSGGNYFKETKAKVKELPTVVPSFLKDEVSFIGSQLVRPEDQDWIIVNQQWFDNVMEMINDRLSSIPLHKLVREAGKDIMNQSKSVKTFEDVENIFNDAKQSIDCNASFKYYFDARMAQLEDQ